MKTILTAVAVAFALVSVSLPASAAYKSGTQLEQSQQNGY